MANLPLLAASAAGAACCVAALFTLRAPDGDKQVRGRMRMVALPAAAAAPRGPDIRRDSGESALDRALARCGRSPHVPSAWRIAWPLVLLGGIAAACGAAFVAATVLGAPAAPIAGLGGFLLMVNVLFRGEVRRYRDRIFQQIPDALGLILRAIRAGLPMAEAIANAAREVPSPTREEFARVVSGTAIGQPLDRALFGLAERTGLTEYFFLAVTIGLQSQTGGNLGETLENLADMVRKRVTMMARVKAVTAEGRLSAMIMAGLPFAASGAIALTSPGHLVPLFTTDGGIRLLLVGLLLMGSGLLIIRWMLRSAVSD
ncbi:type II secretion system F family protein [Falsiroseomonas tokyonensis]|uniref:Type II secretion system F family protein n=1 Tax=Falsiroseomonas tokyonensis TaxID=430521 RepID=A0ABV7BSE3_9PROT|nr:type II secretion system F family protein [Falsiroseomonas tokyonensis]MBU8537356.1 type II secretion system F family protein [Falsiroseomonas tokyonensis]